MEHGRRIIHESYFDGKLSSKKIEYQEPQPISSQSQVAKVIIQSLELISTGKTKTMTLEVKANDRNEVYLVTKSYIIKE